MQRGLIFTEHKPSGRLYKMCDPFRQQMDGFQLVCYTATLFTTDGETKLLQVVRCFIPSVPLKVVRILWYKKR
jgi:hypothetical protein